jgi:hypothetical protein
LIIFPLELSDAKDVCIGIISSLIGLYSSSRCVILLPPLFSRYLDIEKCDALQKNCSNYDAKITLTNLAKQEIVW